MKKKNSYAIFVVIILIFSGCSKDDYIYFDKEVIIHLASNIGADSEPYVHVTEPPYFDISNYSNVKSVKILASDIQTIDSYGNDLAREGKIELYDFTNNKVIENSFIISDDTQENEFVSSANLINDIPEEKIKLGVKITAGSDFVLVARNVSLVLSRE